MAQSKTNKPIIGISLDYEQAGGYNSEMPWYALRENYCSVISDFGAIPIALPYDISSVESYIDMIDGLMLTGGFFDIDPEHYGQNEKHQETVTKDKRTAFEMTLTKEVLHHKIPMLGICAGEQLLNVILGGTLIQHIPDEIENCLEHEQKTTHDRPAHPINIVKDTLLHEIVAKDKMVVNSSHHQAVKTTGEDVVVSATAPDNVIEAIEYTKHPFCIGVEWHPEYLVDEGDALLFKAFIDNCKK